MSHVAIIGVYRGSQFVQNFEPRCSTQPSKSALVIRFGVVEHRCVRREDLDRRVLLRHFFGVAPAARRDTARSVFGTNSCVL